MIEDEKILIIYMCGFYDALYDKPKRKYEEEIKSIAYLHGRVDAVVGDDISKVDKKTEKEIIEEIKRHVQSRSTKKINNTEG